MTNEVKTMTDRKTAPKPASTRAGRPGKPRRTGSNGRSRAAARATTPAAPANEPYFDERLLEAARKSFRLGGEA